MKRDELTNLRTGKSARGWYDQRPARYTPARHGSRSMWSDTWPVLLVALMTLAAAVILTA